jgi:hypothetical protein
VRLKAIVLWQPWASLIAVGAKPLEFRSWSYLERPTGVRPGDRVAIAAGARAVRRAEVRDLLRRLDDEAGSTGLVPDKARALLEAWERRSSAMTPEQVVPNPCPTRVIVCTATIGEPKLSVDAMPKWKEFINDSDRLEHSKWAWPMLDVRPTEPIPTRGGQRFFWVSV